MIFTNIEILNLSINNMHKVEGIFFDLGDTIVGVNKFYKDNCKEVLSRLFFSEGYRAKPNEIYNALVETWRIAESEDNFDPGEFARERLIPGVAKKLGFPILERTTKTIYKRVFESLLEETRLASQAIETLQAYKEMSIPLVLTTDISNYECQRILTKHRLAWHESKSKKSSLFFGSDQKLVSDYFNMVITSEAIGAPKSTKIPYTIALNKFGLESTRTVVIGNDEKSDMKPAKELEMIAIKVRQGWTKNEPTIADYVVDEFHQTLPIVESISQP